MKRLAATLCFAVLLASCGGESGGPSREIPTLAEDATTTTAAARSDMTLNCSRATSDGSKHEIDLNDFGGSVFEAKAALCPPATTTTTAADQALGQLANPLPAGTGLPMNLADEEGDSWNFGVAAITVLSDESDALIGRASRDWAEDLRDGNVVVMAEISVDHVSGPQDQTFAPFSVFMVDGDRRSIDQETFVWEWADGTNENRPKLPPGTRGEWRVTFQVPEDAVSGMVVAVDIFGGDIVYFHP